MGLADLHLQAVARTRLGDSQRKHLLAARDAPAAGVGLLAELRATADDDRSEHHGTTQDPR